MKRRYSSSHTQMTAEILRSIIFYRKKACNLFLIYNFALTKRNNTWLTHLTSDFAVCLACVR